MDEMIQIDDLHKSYGLVKALKGISFHVPKGQVVGFLGPNGAGKSTTMKILTGYVEANHGVVKVGGISVRDDAVGARRKIGYLPENNPLYEDMMVDEYLHYVASVRQIPAAEREKKIAIAVARCGLQKVRGKDVGDLSKGYRQRVGLAQAIVHDPDLLILDEPTTGLDPNQVVEIRNLIRELGQQKTVILSTHVLPEVQHMCSRAIIISDGRIVADGAPDALAGGDSNTVDVVLVAKEGATDKKRAREMLRALPSVSEVVDKATHEENACAFGLVSLHDVRKELFAAAVRNDLVLLALEARHKNLEDTFRKLTTTDANKASAAVVADKAA